MPIPKPSEDEDREDFIERCMSSNIMEEEFPDNSQRLAVCSQQWEKGGELILMTDTRLDDKPFEATKEFSFEVKELDEEKRIFEGYASVFGNVDAYNDIVQKGAFKKTIDERVSEIKILWQHDTHQPIGKLIEAKEDQFGLKVKGKISNTEKGKEALQLMKDGVINQLSIGYDTVKKEYNDDGHRLLKEIKLYEVSPVTFAANTAAEILGVKSLAERYDKKDFMANVEEQTLKEERWKIQSAFDETVYDLLNNDGLSDEEKIEGFRESLSQYNSIITAWFEQMVDANAKSFIKIDEVKAGRTISEANYVKLENALQLLQEVLDSEPRKSTQEPDDKGADSGDNESGNHSDNNKDDDEMDKEIEGKLDEILEEFKNYKEGD